MKVDRAAETVVASPGHAQSRRKSLQIRINRRQHGILAVMSPDVGVHSQTIQAGVVLEAIGAVYVSRIAVAGKVDVSGEEAQNRRQRKAKFAKLDRRLRS